MKLQETLKEAKFVGWVGKKKVFVNLLEDYGLIRKTVSPKVKLLLFIAVCFCLL